LRIDFFGSATVVAAWALEAWGWNACGADR
jgi:hypothetical protein